MSVAKVSEIIASSTTSFDDAIKMGVARAHKTLRDLSLHGLKSADQTERQGTNHGIPGPVEDNIRS